MADSLECLYCHLRHTCNRHFTLNLMMRCPYDK